MGSIVIAEKPSQAALYREAVGSRYGKILAARGHLFELAEPEDVNPAWKDWSVGIMRPESGFYPNRIKKDRDGDAKKRYQAILAAAKTADTIYIATDPDREGEGIGTNIVKALRRDIQWQGHVFRVIQNTQDEEALREAFAQAQPAANFNSLYQSFVARQQADQMFNLSLTRSASELFKPAGWRGALSVGRVLTPTFGMVCRREREIAGFVPQDYFHPWVEVEGQAGRVRLTHAPAEADRIFDRAAAQRLADGVSGYGGPINVRTQRKKQAPPALFSLAKLQAEAARRFKWPVSKTTDVLQAIYDAEAVTYPRSSEKSLWEADIKDAPAMLEGLLQLPGMGDVSWAGGGPVIRVKPGAFSDKDLKGSAHTAIVPNVRSISKWPELLGGMSSDQKKLFELIARRYLAAIGPDRVYDSTKQWITVERVDFSVTGTVELEPGWREALGRGQKPEQDEDAEEDSGSLPAFKDGDQVSAADIGVAAKTTTPPPRYTDATLVIAMIEAWRFVDDPDIRAALKETDGIGTEATRGTKNGVVPNLLKKGYVSSGKGGVLTATQAGLEFYDILMKAAPRLLDVGLTGHMEILLEAIKRGDAKAVGVVNEIIAVAQEAVDNMVAAKSAGASIKSSQSRPPSEGMKKAARAKAQREGKRVPPGVLQDMAKCREYLGPLPDRPKGDGPRPPSEKALSFARKIAGEQGVELPDDAVADAKALSKWIDQHKGRSQSSGKKSQSGAASGRRAPARPGAASDGRPSSKQVGYAETIAGRKGIDIPPECYQDRARMSKWIDAHGN